MCGIVGYLGKRNAFPILIDGLKKLEYRGYDSCGVVLIDKEKVYFYKKAGKVVDLEKEIKDKDFKGNIGLGHTRWATHGGVNDINAHPHFDCFQNIFLVHNGIIENYKDLKEKLLLKGHQFVSETDTEIFAHLIEEYYQNKSFEEAILEALKEIKGTFAFAILNKKEPNKLIGIRFSSPLILGIGQEEYILASDPSPISMITDKVVYLDDGDMVVIDKDKGIKIISFFDEKEKEIKIHQIDWKIENIEKENYEHFMIKEIEEEPKVVFNTFYKKIDFENYKVNLKELEEIKEKLKNIEKIIFTACGTAYYACLYGKYLFEEYLNLSSESEIASELRYRNYPYNQKTLLIAISQSGETMDTIEAIKIAQSKNVLTLGIINVPGSTIARLVDYVIYTQAGPELAVASTKAFSAQITALLILMLYLAEIKNINLLNKKEIFDELKLIPEKIKKIIENQNEIKNIANELTAFKNFYFLARKFQYPIALEGALKLKEIAYVHSEAYPAGEMKHGPIALIDENFPVFVLAPHDSVYKKTISNLEEIKARNGKTILISNEEFYKTDYFFKVPQTIEILYPFLTVTVVHLFAYYFAKILGREIDRPRNLAKSVTVE